MSSLLTRCDLSCRRLHASSSIASSVGNKIKSLKGANDRGGEIEVLAGSFRCVNAFFDVVDDALLLIDDCVTLLVDKVDMVDWQKFRKQRRRHEV